MTDKIAVQSNGISITADGQIIVSKLRPMSEVPAEEDCIFFSERYGIVSGFEYDGHIFTAGRHIDGDECIGWLPMPIYKPE